MLKVNDKVNIKGSNDKGIIIKSELKRFAHINNGKQIRIYSIQLENGNIIEYEASDLQNLTGQ